VLCSVSFVFLTDEVVRLVRGFASNWKGSIESLNRDVMRQFTNFRNGTGILQVEAYWSVYCYVYKYNNYRPIPEVSIPNYCLISPEVLPPSPCTPTQGVLTKMIQFYHRFTKLLALEPFKDVPVQGQLLNIHHIMVEVKKYKQNF